MAFQEQLILYRKQLGLSQEQLGNLIGVSRQTVSKWELGETTPEMEKLIQLSRIFKTSIDKLVGNDYAEPQQSDLKQAEKVEIHLHRWHYEYKSQRTLFGIPLIHINIGHGLYKAKGIIAVGMVARGILSVGGLSMGIISLGGISCGLLSIGGISLALLMAIGGFSLGTIAMGGLALGIFALGGAAFGVYSVGGAAMALKIAAGGYASAPVAIGDSVRGQYIFDINDQLYSNEIRNAILNKFPETRNFIVELFSMIK